MTKLTDLGLDQDALSDPLTYPGRMPDHSGVLVGDRYLRVRPRSGRRLGQHRVVVDEALPRLPDAVGDSLPLNHVLDRLNVARVDDRFPVLAIGSNASPGQMRAKLERAHVSGVLPMIRAEVSGWQTTVAAHVSRPGYLPISAVRDPDARAVPMMVLLCDRSQVGAIDDTEPNYWRVAGDGLTPVVLDGGETLTHFLMYLGKHGVLADGSGHPVPWSSEPDAIQQVLESLDNPKRLGRTPAEFVHRCATDEQLRDWVRTTMQAQGRVIGVPEARHGHLLPYGHVCATDSAGAGVVVATPAGFARDGQPSIGLHPDWVEALGGVHHAVVANRRDSAAPRAVAHVVPLDVHRSQVAVDQLVRNALGVEIGEELDASPATIPESRLGDLLFGRRHYLLCRVQPADLVTVEREACLLEQMSLHLLGVDTGDSVVLEGLPGQDGNVPQVRLRAYPCSDAVLERRSSLSGGDFASRFPSTRDALGVHPDLPWIFLDTDQRTSLGLVAADGGPQKLGVVRIRASRRDLLAKEVRELLLLLVLAVVGLLTALESTTTRVLAIFVTAMVLLAVIWARVRRRFLRR